MKLTNNYQQLGPLFCQEILPTPVALPTLFLWNERLANTLAISADIKKNAAEYFSGNQLLLGSIPIASAYAGHQFGGFNPQLGDGRAHLLGEFNYQEDHINKVADLQLKGSGKSQFSRRGDGRCALKPAVREFIMSEAMYALDIPTTQILSVVTTGEDLYRQGLESGAVVARVAASHIRVGTFQYFANQNDLTSLSKLLDFAIQRHYPEIAIAQPLAEKVIQFIQAVIDKQITTIVHWMRVGFIHGVMNTDNVAISGETIDYGPCAMMGTYNPQTVFSSIDDGGRYSYGNQPVITQWNMARFAEALLPLVDDDSAKAVKLVEPLIRDFTTQYEEAYYQMMSNKLGIANAKPKTITDTNRALVDQLLEIMQSNKLDYTQTFIGLMSQLDPNLVSDHNDEINHVLFAWYPKWRALIQSDIGLAQMRKSNPLVIPRNHHIETILEDCQLNGTTEQAEKLLKVLRSPYQKQAETVDYQDLNDHHDKNYQTFCGT